MYEFHTFTLVLINFLHHYFLPSQAVKTFTLSSLPRLKSMSSKRASPRIAARNSNVNVQPPIPQAFPPPPAPPIRRIVDLDISVDEPTPPPRPSPAPRPAETSPILSHNNGNTASNDLRGIQSDSTGSSLSLSASAIPPPLADSHDPHQKERSFHDVIDVPSFQSRSVATPHGAPQLFSSVPDMLFEPRMVKYLDYLIFTSHYAFSSAICRTVRG